MNVTLELEIARLRRERLQNEAEENRRIRSLQRESSKRENRENI